MRNKVLLSLGLAAGVLAAPQFASAGGGYNFTDVNLTATGYVVGNISGINGSGTLVATGTPVVPGPPKGLVFSTSVSQVSVTGANYVYLSHIANNGNMVGYYTDNTVGIHGMTVSGSTVTAFNYPGAISTAPTCLAENGNILGGYEDNVGVHAFIYSGGTFTSYDLPGADQTIFFGQSGGGTILGRSIVGSTFGAFLLDGKGNTTPVTVTGASQVYVEGMNSSGLIAGYYALPTAPDLHGFVQDSKGTTVLDHPWGITITQDFGNGNENLTLRHTYTVISSVNDNGVVAGSASAVYQNATHYSVIRTQFTAAPKGK